MTTPATTPGRVTIASAVLMTAVAGYIDAFLYLRHQTFGFAQTGNIIFLAVLGPRRLGATTLEERGGDPSDTAVNLPSGSYRSANRVSGA